MEENMQEITSFYKLLTDNADKYKDRTAILYDTYDVSYNNFMEDAVKKAMHLKQYAGKRIALCGPTSYRWIVNLFGIVMAGKDAILVDFFLPHDERSSLLERIKTDYILSSTNQYILADEHAIIIAGADHDNEVDIQDYDKNTREGNILLFTATADESDKAVVLTTSNLLNTVKAISSRCKCDSDDRVLAQTPLHHIFGLAYSLLWPLTKGACVCVGRGLRHIDADTYYYNATILPGTPSMIKYLKKVKAFNKELRTIIIGGATCPYRLFEYLKDRDYEVYSIYGMTECSGCIAISNHMDGSYDIYDGTEVTLSKDGEILVSGPCVMAGYDKDDITNDKVITDNAYHTGDYGHFNHDGRLVLDRRNAGILLLPTGEKICRKVVNEEVTSINGVAESFLGLCDDKLTAVVVPVKKNIRYETMKRKIDRYNEKKGFRWEIQKLILLDRPLPRFEDGSLDFNEIEDIMIKR